MSQELEPKEKQPHWLKKFLSKFAQPLIHCLITVLEKVFAEVEYDVTGMTEKEIIELLSQPNVKLPSQHELGKVILQNAILSRKSINELIQFLKKIQVTKDDE